MWPEVQGCRVAVIGSAPSASLPSPDTYDRLIAVSGAIALTPVPDIWMINFHTIRGNTAARLRTVEQYQSRRTRRLVFLEPNTGAARLDAWMRSHKVHAKTVTSLTKSERVQWLHRAGFTNSKTPSSGLMAVCFSLLSGAKSVAMHGFSTGLGHFYDTTAIRMHVREDLVLYQQLQHTYGSALIGGFSVTA